MLPQWRRNPYARARVKLLLDEIERMAAAHRRVEDALRALLTDVEEVARNSHGPGPWRDAWREDDPQ